MSDINFKELLDWIPCDKCNYSEWVNVGMALKAEGCSFDMFDEWSSKDPARYSRKECMSKWFSFDKSGITGGTLVHMAEMNGWTRPPKQNDYFEDNGKYYKATMEIDETGYGGTISFDEVGSDVIIKDEGLLQIEEFFEPDDDTWNPVDDLRNYLEAVFEPSDIIAYTVTSKRNNKGKLAPFHKGVFTRTANDIINDLNKYHSVTKAIGTYDPEAGAWIRFNPFNGLGVENSNVMDYRYTLVESDDMELGKQIAIIRKLMLPVVALVYSGGKSIHAIVHVDATTKDQYVKRVSYIYEICEKNGLALDKQNKNPSRLSRMPGVIRNGHKQFLIDTNFGMDSYESWADWVEEETNSLPEPTVISEYWDNRPAQDPELIEGILRQGRKMMIGGASKIGKTSLMIQLALSICNGFPWLGFPCEQKKVLYLNFELPEPTFNERLEEICRRKGWKLKEVTKQFHILHLRGVSFQSVDGFVEDLCRKFKNSGYGALFIDPIYKINDGDENKAQDVARFTKRLDRITKEMNTSLIYVHHFSKGKQSNKDAMDRFSGSGVAARDADVILSLTELKTRDPDRRAFRMESTLREFKDIEPVNLWFDHPVHTVDDSGELRNAQFADQDTTKKEQKLIDFNTGLVCCYENKKYWNEEKKRYEVLRDDMRLWLGKEGKKMPLRTFNRTLKKAMDDGLAGDWEKEEIGENGKSYVVYFLNDEGGDDDGDEDDDD